jgi:dienelactone hydrolase
VSSLVQVGGVVALLGLATGGCSGRGDTEERSSGSAAATIESSGEDGAAMTVTSGRPLTTLPGPTPVGRITLEWDGRTIDVWYPARTQAAGSYELLPEVEAPAPGPAEPIDVRHPLVVFSHGSGGVRFQSYFLAESLASRGYLVAAPDHTGDTVFDLLAGTQGDLADLVASRSADVEATPAAVRSWRPDLIAGGGMAVVGHSFGGTTALLAGAQLDDVAAVVAIAPNTDPIEPSTVVRPPLLVLGGTEDEAEPVTTSSAAALGLAAGEAVRADVVGAGHGSFTNACDFADALRSGPDEALRGYADVLAADTCAPELLPVSEAHDLTNRLLLAFLDRHLLGRDVPLPEDESIVLVR